jgi:perosamine synthetase
MNFIPISKPKIGKIELHNVTDAVKSGWVSSLGSYIDQFESDFAKFCDVQYCVAVSNGTTALHLTLAAAGIGPGDEVIVPDLTFVATANAVRHCGATPVFADIDPITLCILPSSIKKLITDNTKAIIPVHLYGQPCDMDLLNSIALDNNLYIFEDAAEAHGATYKNKKVGSISTAGIFSFYGNKIITTGEGGAITTNSFEFANRLKLLRDHAMSKQRKYWHDEVGYNYRMTNIQAALGCAQLSQIELFIEKRRKVFGWYKELLGENKKIKLNSQMVWSESVYWLPAIEILDYHSNDRDKLIMILKSHNIDSRPFFYPLTSMPMYGGKPLNPNSLAASNRGINLPTYFDITFEEVSYICNILLKEINNVSL